MCLHVSVCVCAQDAVESLLTTFVGRRRELALREQLEQRVHSAAPVIRNARINAALTQVRDIRIDISLSAVL